MEQHPQDENQQPQPIDPTEQVNAQRADELQANLDKLAQDEQELLQRQAKISGKLGDLAVKGSGRDKGLYAAAEVVGARRITDPNKPDHKVELSVVPETATSRLTLGRMMGKLATKTSVHTESGRELRASAAQAPTPATKSRGDVRKELRAAKRIHKQKLRQDRTNSSSVVFGGGIGLGKQAEVRSAIGGFQETRALKREMRTPATTNEEFSNIQAEFEARRQELLRSYDAGEINDEQFVAANRANKLEFKSLEDRHKSGALTGARYIQSKNLIDQSGVVVPAREVRRDMRRERAGAAYTLTAAKKPISTKINAFREKRLNKKNDKVTAKIDTTRARQAEIEAELIRLAEEDS